MFKYLLFFISTIIIIALAIGHCNDDSSGDSEEYITISQKEEDLSSDNLSDGWTEEELAKANTAKDASYLSEEEKTVIMLYNLARLNGKKFGRTYVDKYDQKNDLYHTSLLIDLEKTKDLPMLIPDRELHEAAKYHATDMGKAGSTGHNSSNGISFSERIFRFCPECSCAENCYYGNPNPGIIVVTLLVDRNVQSLGHRYNILNSIFGRIGVSIQPHKTYGSNCVTDFASPITTTDKERASVLSIAEEKLNNLEIPRLTSKRDEQILYREGYTTSYNKTTKNSNWVAWHLPKEHTDGPCKRKGIPYFVDTDVKGARQELSDYYNPPYPIDHGHMCPAGDNKWSKKAMEQTFLLTNMSPQYSALNKGDWEELERRCRGWARHYGEIWIVCGPIFNPNYRTIGNGVGVPDAFFKVILRMGKRPKALGFIYPNNQGRHDMSFYLRSVDEVEIMTGIDFFYNLPEDIETIVESDSNLKEW